MQKKSIQIQKFFFRMICGFFLGISIIAPGVSGSVLAVMLGIYPELIQIISAPFKHFKRNVSYLIPLGIGAIISLALFVLIFSFLFDYYPLQAVVLFIGLIVGGLPAIFKKATKAPYKTHYMIGALAAFVLTAAMSFFLNENPAALHDIPFFYLCISGFLAGIVSITPGLSVSIVLMLLGVYEYLLHSAALFTTDIVRMASVIVPFIVFFAIGMVAFSKIIRFLFARYPSFAYYLILGFVCGTIFAVFPRTAPGTIGDWIGCVAMFAVGVATSFAFEWLGKRFNKVSNETTGY